MRINNKSSEQSSNESNSKRREVILYESSSFGKCHFNKQITTHKMKRNHKMKSINEMTKAELLDEIQRVNDICETNEAVIMDLTQKLEASSKDGRKSQVLDLLRENTTISILEISSKLGISTKNVSSQLTYLRSDGYQIFTDPNGRKCLFEDKTNIIHSVNEDDSITEDDMETLVDSADSEESIE